MPEPIPQAELLSMVLPLLEAYAGQYHKTARVRARIAEHDEQVDTRTSDGLETTNTAHEGDVIVTNPTDAGESYVLSQDSFSEKYEKDADGLYHSTRTIFAIELTDAFLEQLSQPQIFYFIAPWNEKMVAKAGDFLAIPQTKDEVYRIARKEFEETYERL